MTKLENISMIKEANVYFDGKVVSRTIYLEDGSRQTLGVMQAGEYTFDTNEAEIMEMMSGDLEVKLPGESEFKTLNTPESFNVPANSSFDLRVKTVTDYCCSYIVA
ncbi:pyrimidine/purine nucleoside phosphorylase [Candidatus Sulfurimonas marisnigri]|uniref:Pyrimidine/purine nucleoside phosphorylase n=1 Tax=Candidatus Sulfurimonas marisnigri TaxID=2740405 RepID=A0A7S7M2V9_9BACT|nr:pyrimidine/purine nucleoside phosphorylase [Candidatus Sulfurimonas marisnigri]QOY55638.1 pyrimidine/purine nucleoside phosphorylase [Candidatus Sulfurimonas marisnigri]